MDTAESWEKVIKELGATLPSLRFAARYSETNFALCVEGATEDDEQVLGVAIDAGGGINPDPRATAAADAWIRGTATDWSDFLSGDETVRLRTGGADDLAQAWLASLETARRPPTLQ